MSPARIPYPTAVTLGAALALAACGGGEAPATTAAGAAVRTPTAAPTRPAPAPALCGPMRVKQAGTVNADEATELSGLVASHDQPGVLWTHNDSGDRPRVFALRTDGTLLASLDVPGAEAVDWEDLAIGPGGDLLLGDIGDNGSARDSTDVYRVPEPRLPASGVTAAATRLRLRYPDGAHDAETLLADPRTGELLVVTKQLDGRSGVYAATVPARGAAGAEATLRKTGTLRLGFGGLATGGDVSADGRTVVVRTYTGFSVWSRKAGASLAATLRRTPCTGRVSLLREGQGEAIALSRDGRSFFTVPEGAAPMLRRYSTRQD